MADTPDTPSTTDDAKPTPRRHASPRKTTAKPRAAAASRVRTAKTAAADTVKAAAPAKPRSTSRAKPRTAAKTSGTSTRQTSAAKSADTAKRSVAARKGQAKSAIDRATDKVGGKWGAAGIVGGIAAAGAAAAALLTLRGSSNKNLGTQKKPIDISGTGDKGKGHGQTVHAHQPDGTDSSKSFQAGIADENTIPAKV